MNSKQFNERLELAILLSDCLESVTKELDSSINDPILQMKFNKVKVSTTQLNNKLNLDFIDKVITHKMGDYCEDFRTNCETFIKEYQHGKDT